MSNSIVTLEIGGQTLHCHVTATLGEPTRTFGPPERCHEGSPDELEVEQVFLEVEVAEDLSPNPRALRNVEIDITEMLVELGLSDKIDELCLAKFDWDALSAEPDHPEEP